MRLPHCLIPIVLCVSSNLLAEEKADKELLPIPDKLVVLTFDDCNKSDRAFVADVVKEHGFGATFFVTEGLGFLKSKKNYTTWEEIVELHGMGFEIGNHTKAHRGVGSLNKEKLAESLEHIDQRCAENGIPRPTTFCYPGFGHNLRAVEVLDEKKIYTFARRGVRPEYEEGGHGSRGPAYDPKFDHPLLVPTTWYSGPESGFDDLKWAIEQARDGEIAVLCYHGVPAIEHPWVNTDPEAFKNHMQYLKDEGCTVIAMRDLSKYVDSSIRAADPYENIAMRQAIVRQTVEIGSRRELFVDEHMIDLIEGDGKLHLHQPAPEEVVLTTDKPWEGNTSAYYTIFQDDDLYRMYYRGSHYNEETKKATHREVTCYAQSKDGIHWTKPELGLFDFEGSKANNIVWDGIGTHCFTVFKDENPKCQAEAKFKAISRGRPNGKKGLYVFQSPDGIHWSLIRDEPVITDGAFDSQNLAFWDAHAGAYRAFHRFFGDGVRAIKTETSDDFVNWSEPAVVTYGDAPNEHLYTNAVQPYSRAPHILIGFPTRYLPDQGQRVEPTFMASRDGGLTFRRWLDPVIPESAPKDRGGNRSNYMTWGLLSLPGRSDELSVYASEAYYTGPDSRLRRFTYRVDGFVSFRAEGGATLRTKPVVFEGSLLEVNYAASGGDALRAELQDANGRPLEGFTLDVCEPVTGDSTGHTIEWKGADLRSLEGRPIRIKFQLNGGGDLFSFQFREGE
jgi:peptidoglycan/xylan/chitin deacetylase (PgdA/CDA1 family)